MITEKRHATKTKHILKKQTINNTIPSKNLNASKGLAIRTTYVIHTINTFIKVAFMNNTVKYFVSNL